MIFNLIRELGGRTSKVAYLRIAIWVETDRQRFEQLIRAFVSGPPHVAEHASRAVSAVVQHAPEMLNPHLNHLLNEAAKPSAPTAVRRNVMRTLQFVSIPEIHQSATANLALNLFMNRRETIAVRVFSMTVLANLCAVHPELKNELIPAIEDELPFGSPAFRSRGAKILRSLKTRSRLL